MAFSSRVALLWIVSMSSDRFPFSAIFNFGNIQKSQGAMSGLYRGWRSCTILCFAKNFCTRFDEYAGAVSWWKSRLTRNAVVLISRHHTIFSELQRNILCWSSDLLEQIRSAQHPHNRKKLSALTWHSSHFDELFSAVARLDASTVKIVVLFQNRNRKPMIEPSNNLLKDIFTITDHFQVVLSDFRAKVFLLGREQFQNEFSTHASHS